MRQEDCSIDKISLANVPICTANSYKYCWQDVQEGTNVFDAISKNDRAIYIIITLLIVFCILLFFCKRNEYTQFFLDDPQWNPNLI